MRLAIGQVHVHREARARIPGRRDPARCRRSILEGLGHAGAGRPREGRVAGWGDGGVGGVADSAVDDVVALGAVDTLPVALRGRVGRYELTCKKSLRSVFEAESKAEM